MNRLNATMDALKIKMLIEGDHFPRVLSEELMAQRVADAHEKIDKAFSSGAKYRARLKIC